MNECHLIKQENECWESVQACFCVSQCWFAFLCIKNQFQSRTLCFFLADWLSISYSFIHLTFCCCQRTQKTKQKSLFMLSAFGHNYLSFAFHFILLLCFVIFSFFFGFRLAFFFVFLLQTTCGKRNNGFLSLLPRPLKLWLKMVCCSVLLLLLLN